MKKVISIIFCLIFLCGCSQYDGHNIRESSKKFTSNVMGEEKLVKISNPDSFKEFVAGNVIGYSEELASAKIHFKPQNGWMGDIHPVYANGKWNLLYLEVPNEPDRNGLDGVKQSMIFSNDLVSWKQEQVKNTLEQRPWWAIGNFYENGKLYSVYNDILGQGYGMDVSNDLKTWVSGGDILKYTYVPGEPRDPYLFKNDLTNEYWLVFAVNKQNIIGKVSSGAFYYSKSKDLESFSMPELLYDPGNINVPECPEIFKFGDKYYLIGSWGTDRVGTARYRISEKPEGPWETPLIDRLDSTEVMAGNSTSDGNRRIMFGWIPTYSGRIDNGDWQWGGHLALPRELYPSDDGSRLFVKAPKELDNIRKSILYDITGTVPEFDRVLGDGWYTSKKGFLKNPNSDYGEVWLSNEYSNFDISFNLSLDGNCPGAGFVFRCGNQSFDGYEIYFDVNQQRIVLRNHFEKRKIICETPADIKPGINMPVRIIIDGDIVEVFFDNKYVLAGRVQTFTSVNKIGFFTESNGAAFTYPKVFGIE